MVKVLKRTLQKSFEYQSRAERVIPMISQTVGKAPRYLVRGVYPVYLQKGEGSHVFDVDGNEYIDYILGLGPVTLGYNYPVVNEAITGQLKSGTIFSLPHPLEIELAERLIEVIPCAEMVRFSKTGSEATSAAVRATRACTNKEKIAYYGYHGWHEWYSVTTTRNKGIPRALKYLVFPFQYNEIESLERLFEQHKGEIGTVIMEPTILEPPQDSFLERVKDLTHQNGALLIFDEIVTGFRMSLGGAQEYFSITPDLATFGKGMANGMPIGAVVGTKEVMQMFEEVFFSSTFGGETLSLAASLATIRELQEKKAIQHIWRTGKKLTDGFNNLAKALDVDAESTGFPCHPKFALRDRGGSESSAVKSLFMQEMVKRGILMHSGAINLCFSHNNSDIDRTLEACEDALKIVKRAVAENKVGEMLEGEVFEQVFGRLF